MDRQVTVLEARIGWYVGEDIRKMQRSRNINTTGNSHVPEAKSFIRFQGHFGYNPESIRLSNLNSLESLFKFNYVSLPILSSNLSYK